MQSMNPTFTCELLEDLGNDIGFGGLNEKVLASLSNKIITVALLQNPIIRTRFIGLYTALFKAFAKSEFFSVLTNKSAIEMSNVRENIAKLLTEIANDKDADAIDKISDNKAAKYEVVLKKLEQKNLHRLFLAELDNHAAISNNVNIRRQIFNLFKSAIREGLDNANNFCRSGQVSLFGFHRCHFPNEVYSQLPESISALIYGENFDKKSFSKEDIKKRVQFDLDNLPVTHKWSKVIKQNKNDEEYNLESKKEAVKRDELHHDNIVEFHRLLIGIAARINQQIREVSDDMYTSEDLAVFKTDLSEFGKLLDSFRGITVSGKLKSSDLSGEANLSDKPKSVCFADCSRIRDLFYKLKTKLKEPGFVLAGSSVDNANRKSQLNKSLTSLEKFIEAVVQFDNQVTEKIEIEYIKMHRVRLYEFGFEALDNVMFKKILLQHLMQLAEEQGVSRQYYSCAEVIECDIDRFIQLHRNEFFCFRGKLPQINIEILTKTTAKAVEPTTPSFLGSLFSKSKKTETAPAGSAGNTATTMTTTNASNMLSARFTILEQYILREVILPEPPGAPESDKGLARSPVSPPQFRSLLPSENKTEKSPRLAKSLDQGTPKSRHPRLTTSPVLPGLLTRTGSPKPVITVLPLISDTADPPAAASIASQTDPTGASTSHTAATASSIAVAPTLFSHVESFTLDFAPPASPSGEVAAPAVEDSANNTEANESEIKAAPQGPTSP